jgi:3-isopropylmalate/(R)-2-methylmalate dehydratase large subunit
MGMTISEKILAKASGQKSVKANDIIWATVDKAMLDDILGPIVVIDEYMRAHGSKIWDPNKVVVISDHYTPAANPTQAAVVKLARDWSGAFGVKNYFELEGPCHQVMVEGGFALPGTFVLGTDSHTVTYGALGCFATGVGSTEMLGVLLTGETWIKVPETILYQWDGKLPEFCMAKDIILKSIGDTGHDGATYMAMEFAGSTIRDLCVDERLCITNMAVEAGAKNGIIAPDEKVTEYLKNIGVKGGYKFFASDKDASYVKTYTYDASALEPVVACPHEVDNVFNVREIDKVRVDQVYIGSCTGGRMSDLAAAAKILKGKKVAKGTRLLVSPASKKLYNECLKNGIFDTLAQAGATILASTCGACLGVHSGAIADGEVCVSTTNRNFLGRMGSKKSDVYLSSPMTAAASAVTGYITDVRDL